MAAAQAAENHGDEYINKYIYIYYIYYIYIYMYICIYIVKIEYLPF